MQARISIPDWAREIASDHTDMDRAPHPVDADKVSSFSFELPDDAYFEYAFIDADGRMRADPENEVRAQNPWYPEVSAIFGPDYEASPYAELYREKAAGELDRHRLDSEELDSMRRLNVYTPQGQQGEELPLVLVHDGPAFQRMAGLPQVLEALIGEGKARPARLAFVEPADRVDEYGFDEEYRRFTTNELLPFVAENYRGSGETMLMGASLGGLVSATLALLDPDRFSALATFSGAFYGTPVDRRFYGSRDSWVLDQVAAASDLSLRWYLEVGTLEWLTDVNRELKKMLEGKGVDYRYVERNAGHNWTSWRNGLADALEFILRP